MKTLTFKFIVSNSAGPYTVYSKDFELMDAPPVTELPPIIDSVIVEPASGYPGTLFTITINAHDPNAPPLDLHYSNMAIYEGSVIIGYTINTTDQPNVFTWQS